MMLERKITRIAKVVAGEEREVIHPMAFAVMRFIVMNHPESAPAPGRNGRKADGVAPKRKPRTRTLTLIDSAA